MTREEKKREEQWRAQARPTTEGYYPIRGVRLEIHGRPWVLELHEWGWHAEHFGFRTRSYSTAERAIAAVEALIWEEG